MSMTIGFVLRFDQAPAAPAPPPVVPTTAVETHWHNPEVVAETQGAASSRWLPSSGRFPAHASTTYGPRGEPNRPWLPQRSRIDPYA